MPNWNTDDWTFGAEHEFGDWHYNGPLPEGYGRDTRDFTCMSSNGIANDPKGISYAYGGEINTPPYNSAHEMAGGMHDLARFLVLNGSPAPTVNHRSNLHVHIRVPGLKDDLSALKQLQKFIHAHMRNVLEVIQPLPRPTPLTYVPPERRTSLGQSLEEAYQGALRRWRRRRVSHQTLLTPNRLARQLAADTVEEFFKAEVPQSKGKPQWHLQPRVCVNVRQLLETDTIEFRHFAGTLSPDKLFTAGYWAKFFLKCALNNDDRQLYIELGKIRQRTADWGDFPTFPAYIHYLENRYRATCHDGTLKRPEIEANIQRILAGEFDDFPV